MSWASILPVWLGYGLVVVILWAIVIITSAVALAIAVSKQPPQDVSQARPVTLRLDELYWSTRTEEVNSRNDWSTFERITETDTHVCLELREFVVFAIPKSAFTSPTEARDFANFAREKIAAASPPDPSPAPRWPLTEPELLHTETQADVIRLRYTPSLQQAMELGLYGQNPPQPTGFAWLALVFFLGLLVFSVLGIDTAAGQVLLCLAFALVSGILATQLYGAHRRWRWRNQFGRRPPETTTLTFSPRGIGQMTASCERFTKWSAYERFTLTEQYFVLYGRPFVAEDAHFARTAFTEADQAALAALIEEHIKPTADDADVLTSNTTTTETGNPYQPPRL